MNNNINILLHIYKAKEIFFLQFYIKEKQTSIKSCILFLSCIRYAFNNSQHTPPNLEGYFVVKSSGDASIRAFLHTKRV